MINFLKKLNPFKRRKSTLGEKPSEKELSMSKAVLDKDFHKSEREMAEKKKRGDAIPIFSIENPDPELIDFAKEFSSNYEILQPSDYYSNKKTYHIKYMPAIQNAWSGGEVSTPARVGNVSGVIEFSKKILLSCDKITSDWVFWLVIWCIVRKQVDGLEKPDSKADEITTQYYATTNRSAKSVLFGFLEMMRNEVNKEYNNNRYQKINQLIHSHLKQTQPLAIDPIDLPENKKKLESWTDGGCSTGLANDNK